MNTFKPLFILAALGVALVVVYTALSRSPRSEHDPPHVEGLAVPSTEAPLVQMPGVSSSASPFGASRGAAEAPESSSNPPYGSAPGYPTAPPSYPGASPYPSSAAAPPATPYGSPVASDPPGTPYGSSAAGGPPGGYDSMASPYPGTSVYGADPPRRTVPTEPAACTTEGCPLPTSLPRADPSRPDVASRPEAEAPAWPAPQSAAGMAPPYPSRDNPRTAEASRYSEPAAPAEPLASLRDAPPPRQEDQQAKQSFQRLMDQVSRDLEVGRLAEAHLALSQFYRKPGLDSQQARQVVQLLDQLAGTVIYSRQSLLEPPHVVRPGDTLQSIADHYNVPPELIANINGMRDPRGVQPGQELKVVRGPFHAVVHLADYELTLMLGGRYAGRFPITVGRDQPNLEGSYVIAGKGVAPTYYGPDGTTFDEHDQRNPLGNLWLGLGDRAGQPGRIGIHGTNDPQTIGRDAPRGNIGLDQRDIQDVYGILSVGSRVVIQR